MREGKVTLRIRRESEGVVQIDFVRSGEVLFSRLLEPPEYTQMAWRPFGMRRWALHELQGEARSPLGRSAATGVLVPWSGERCTLAVVGAIVLLAISIGLFALTSCAGTEVDKRSATAESTAESWFRSDRAIVVKDAAQHFETAMRWDPNRARIAIRWAVVWGTAARTEKSAAAVDAAKRLIGRFSRGEVLDELLLSPLVPEAQRPALLDKARRLIDG